MKQDELWFVHVFNIMVCPPVSQRGCRSTRRDSERFTGHQLQISGAKGSQRVSEMRLEGKTLRSSHLCEFVAEITAPLCTGESVLCLALAVPVLAGHI